MSGVKKLKAILIFSFFYFFFLNNFSLSKDIPIIVISPSKTFQSKGIVGSDVSVISEESINNSSEFFLHDVISENLNGMHFSRTGGVGTNALFQIRGLPKRYTNVYIDGVKMSDPSTSDNAFYFNNLTTNSIKQVEVLKGNQTSISLMFPSICGMKIIQLNIMLTGVKVATSHRKGINLSVKSF